MDEKIKKDVLEAPAPREPQPRPEVMRHFKESVKKNEKLMRLFASEGEAFKEQLEAAEEGMGRYAEALEELAKS